MISGMSKRTLRVTIAHLFPKQMNLYGDLGNIVALVQRLAWRGLRAEVVQVHPGDRPNLSEVDLLFMGGGQDRGQRLVATHLVAMGESIREEIARGLAALVVCGGFQLFGHGFKTVQGDELPGISVFDAYTVGGKRRCIGNVVVDASEVVKTWKQEAEELGCDRITTKWPSTLVGFENHSGLTTIRGETKVLGPLIRGYGNLGDGSGEGALKGHVVGTYLHGPVLPKNPHLADWLLMAAVARRYADASVLDPLDDTVELEAHKAAIARAQTARTAHLFQT